MAASTTRGTSRSGFRRSSGRGGVPTRAAIALGLVLSGGIAGLLLVMWLGSHLLSGVRAYVHGEARYSKGQKDAVVHLQRYARSREELDWRRYAEAIAVPLANARARRLLLRDDPDPEAARSALFEGHNDPDDLDGLIHLFRLRRWLPRMSQGLAIWTEADALVEQLDTDARRMRAELREAGPDSAEVRALLTEVSGLNASLTELETAFSTTMSRGTRRTTHLVLGISTAVVVLFIGAGLGGSSRLVRQMRRREDQFQSIIENASDLITILDRSGRVVYESPAIESMLGYSRKHLVGSNVFEWVHPDDLPGVIATFEDLAEDASPAATRRIAEFRFRHADGSWRTIAATGSSYQNDRGDRHIIVSSRDVTVQRELETRLAQASRLESVGRLAGGVSHDFNNLLTAILGAAEAASAALPQGSPVRAEIAEIIGATSRAADLTRQLLAFARRQVVQPVVFDVAEVVRGMESMLRRLLNESIELSILSTPESVRVRADRSQIEQVVVNLAVNARDAMPKGGRLRITVERRCLDPETAEREADGSPGPFVVIEADDTGVAMDPKVMERIFEPFFTTQRSGQGTGLGLATTYGVVKQSGGFITVSSQRGRGSCFRVYLPESREAETATAPPRRAGPNAGSETILLVEDQPEVRRIAARMLRARGYEVIEMGNGEEAIHWAGDHLADFDLVVTDVVMPRLGGLALAEQLRKRRPNLPVVFTSGYPDDERLLSASDIGTVLVQKPFSPDVLAGRVRALLDAANAAA